MTDHRQAELRAEVDRVAGHMREYGWNEADWTAYVEARLRLNSHTAAQIEANEQAPTGWRDMLTPEQRARADERERLHADERLERGLKL